MIKKIIVALNLILILTQIIFSQDSENEADAIIGTWKMEDDMGILEIFKEDMCYNGKIIWMKKTEKDGSPLKDKKKPDKNLRNREVVGLQVMNNFKYKGNNVWSDGTFYAPRKGKEVDPDFILVNENELNIKISILFFSKTIQLARIDTTELRKNEYL